MLPFFFGGAQKGASNSNFTAAQITPQELKQYPVSITRECMRYQNHVASAIRPEIYETPYIGSGAYKVQLKQCREKKAQLDSRIAQLGQEMESEKRTLETEIEKAAGGLGRI